MWRPARLGASGGKIGVSSPEAPAFDLNSGANFPICQPVRELSAAMGWALRLSGRRVGPK